MRNHRGFTLIELLIVLVIMLTVTASLFKVLNGTQRLSRAQAERVDLQSNVRTAALVVPTELRELNAVVGGNAWQNDILDRQLTSVRYRAMRGMGFICQATATQWRVPVSTWTGYRAPAGAPRDAAYLFVEGATIALDSWLPVTTGAVSTTTCPDGTNAYAFVVPSIAVPANGTPVRIYEEMELSLYVVDGKSWLGARSVSAGEVAPQPLLGPLRTTDGLKFEYFDGAGATATANSNIKSVVLTVRGETSQKVTAGGGSSATNSYVQDSLVTRVSLRNSFRP